MEAEIQVQMECGEQEYWWPLPADEADKIVQGMCAGQTEFTYTRSVTKSDGNPYNLKYAIDTAQMTHMSLEEPSDSRKIQEIRFRVGPFLLTKCSWSVIRTEDDKLQSEP